MSRPTRYKTEQILLGRWTVKGLNRILNKSLQIKDLSETIEFLSREFLGLDYKDSTLIGSIETPEVLVINLKAVDCFTFIDYVEAMRVSGSFLEFKDNLKRLRYQSGKVSFKSRNHFFTDWAEFNSEFVTDVTEKIGRRYTQKSKKILNVKEDGTYLLSGIKPKRRVIRYIPAPDISEEISSRLKTGDYAGIYSGQAGLDVSHVGIIIKAEDKIHLRHASSIKRKVVDEDFKKYMADKLGLVVLRAR